MLTEQTQSIFEDARARLIKELSDLEVGLDLEAKLLAASFCRISSFLVSISVLHEKKLPLEAEIILRAAMETLLWSGGILRHPGFVELVQRDTAQNRHTIAKHIMMDMAEALSLHPDDFILVRETNDITKNERSRLNPQAVAKFANLGKLYNLYSLLSIQAAHPSENALNRHVTLKPSGEISHFQLEPRDADWPRIFHFGCHVACTTAEILGESRKTELHWPAEIMKKCDNIMGANAF